MHIETKVIHAGQSSEPTTGAIMPPITTSSTYIQKSPGKHTGFEYSRSHNPTRYALERSIAKLESSSIKKEDDPTFGGFAFSSGMAAIASILELLEPGSHVIAMDDMYGGTNRLFNQVRKRSQGLSFSFINLTNISELNNTITSKTKLIWIETPTNPTLKVSDLKMIASIAKSHSILCAVDNTFATPILQRPIEFGCDLVMHSATKYLGGHSDAVAGVVVASTAELASKIRFIQNSCGAILGPHDSYMVLRGIKTLGLRMQRHCDSALILAKWLESHPLVSSVIYPGISSHPNYNVASKQMLINDQPAGGGIISVHLKTDLNGSKRFLENVEVFSLAESLGGVESLIEHPAIMTHASVSKKERALLGISDSLIRLSVGIEHVDDLKDGLQKGFDSL